MKIYLTDIIGIHSGTYYYNTAFRDVLKKRFFDVEIVSNYTEEDGSGRKVFLNFYDGNQFSRIFKLLVSFIRYFFFVIRNRSSCFITMMYGNAFEIIFLFPLIFVRRNIIDVHEIISLINDKGSDMWIRKVFARFIYRKIADAVIIHSPRSADFLTEFGFSGTRLEVPHFSYQIKDASDNDKVPDEVRALISDSRINVLFFGFIRRSKGIEVLTEIISKASSFDPNQELNFILAGNDPDNLLSSVKESREAGKMYPVSLLLRYISDRELAFLFKNCDYVFLPYTQISQSGVMEMAIKFRKPLITSGLPYFREMLEMFPSFGYSCDSNDYEGYMRLFKRIIEIDGKNFNRKFYTDSDLAKFMSYKDPDNFLNELENLLSRANKRLAR